MLYLQKSLNMADINETDIWLSNNIDDVCEKIAESVLDSEKQDYMKNFVSEVSETYTSTELQFKLTCMVSELKCNAKIAVSKANKYALYLNLYKQLFDRIHENMVEDEDLRDEQKVEIQNVILECKTFLIQTELMLMVAKKNAELYETQALALTETIKNLPFH